MQIHSSHTSLLLVGEITTLGKVMLRKISYSLITLNLVDVVTIHIV